MKKEEFLKLLKMEDPFKDFVPMEPSTFYGWNGDTPLFGKYLEELKPKLVVEIGPWLGQSTINFAANIKALGLQDTTTLVSIDTWLGAKEHWCDQEIRKHMRIKNGLPTFYQDFMSNVKKANVDDVVVPLPMTTLTGAAVLKEHKLSPDLVYIDGSHELYDVYNDLHAYWEILAPGGVLLGDDLPWDNVKTAVKAFSAEVGAPNGELGVYWLLRKRSE